MISEKPLITLKGRLLIGAINSIGTVTLRTSQRLIALEAGDAVWREFDLK